MLGLTTQGKGGCGMRRKRREECRMGSDISKCCNGVMGRIAARTAQGSVRLGGLGA